MDVLWEYKTRGILTTTVLAIVSLEDGSKPPVLKSNSPLKQVPQTASESDSLFYPVVDEESRLIGIISLLKIKNQFTIDGKEI